MAQITKVKLLKKMAHLESLNDQLSAEVNYVDYLMRVIGFTNGLATLKTTAQEILEKGISIDLNEKGGTND